MEFIMDMVHHNPGEQPFKTKFLNPEELKKLGYNAQVFKHINTAVTFRDYDNSVFSNAPEAYAWIEESGKKLMEEILRAKECGLNVYYHVDLFVLPKVIYDKYKDEICDENGKISIHKEKTLELHRAIFDEIFKRFPIDGLIIRVGETYLHDTPYHTGNGAVIFGDAAEEQAAFIKLIEFLREEVCVKHDKYLFFRTWDYYRDKFHANAEYYLKVTDKIEPHEKLVMSIKHTSGDFVRHLKFNECLGKGKHRQIIEVQCQREYEGKGAYPSYVMNGVINSFCENKTPKGLRDIADNPLICGIYTWSRGGGWYGPYPKNEFWSELNTYVISSYANDTSRTEEEIFNCFAKDRLGLSGSELRVWRELCLTANTAILKGKYVECVDRTENGELCVSGLWLRDDKIGGLRQLTGIFDYLYKNALLEDALIEKKEAVLLWREVRELYEKLNIADGELSAFIRTSIEYAVLLFNVVYCAWRLMTFGYIAKKNKSTDYALLEEAIKEYDCAWAEYKKLEGNEYSSTLYEDKYLWHEGLSETVEYFKEEIRQQK